MSQHVAVIIGVGGIGQAVARRIGPGTRLLIADFDEESLAGTADQLGSEGHDVTSHPVDVSSHTSVAALAKAAVSLGDVRHMVHTAGLGPTQAPVPAILSVDLLGVALALDKFGQIVAPGAAGVVIAGIAAHSHPPFAQEQALQLATVPADQLLGLPVADPAGLPDSGAAYGFAKQANLVRVQAARATWGARGARINSVSPGVVSPPMGQAELDGDKGAYLRQMVGGSNAGRLGTLDDIGAAVDFLLSPAAAYISGTDLVVDGGVIAGLRSGHIRMA